MPTSFPRCYQPDHVAALGKNDDETLSLDHSQRDLSDLTIVGPIIYAR